MIAYTGVFNGLEEFVTAKKAETTNVHEVRPYFRNVRQTIEAHAKVSVGLLTSRMDLKQIDTPVYITHRYWSWYLRRRLE